MLLLAAFAAFGVWRIVAVLRSGVADRTTGLILLVIAPILAAPVVLLQVLDGAGRGIPISLPDAMIAGGLAAVCVVLGVVLLAIGKKKAADG